jgi:hypothetical protein
MYIRYRGKGLQERQTKQKKRHDIVSHFALIALHCTHACMQAYWMDATLVNGDKKGIGA